MADELVDADDKSRLVPKVSDHALSFEGGNNRDGVKAGQPCDDTSVTAPLEVIIV